MDKILKDKKAICFFVLPALTWFVLIAVVPIIQSVVFSFWAWDGITKPTNIGFRNYIELTLDPLFHKAIKNSLILAAASVFIQLPISMLLAQMLVVGVKGERLFLNAFFVPVVISGTVIAHLWMKIYHPSYGLLNNFLDAINMEQYKNQWLGNSNTALAACFVPMVWQYIGYHMLLFYTSSKSLNSEIFDAAKVDGASTWQMSMQVILPQIIPMITASIIFAVIGSLKSFDLIYILTKGGPYHASEVPSLLMYTNIFTTNRYGYASSIAVFIILECLFFTLIIRLISSLFRKKYI